MIIVKNDIWEFQLVLVHERWNAPFQRCSTWWISALRTFYIDRILTTVRCTLYVDISLISVGSLLCLYFFRTQQIKLHSRLQEDWLPLKIFFKRWLLPPTWMQLHGFPLSKYGGSFTCHLESLEYSFHICCFTASSSPSPVLNFRAKTVLFSVPWKVKDISTHPLVSWLGGFYFELWYIWAAANCIKREKIKCLTEEEIHIFWS